MAEEPGGPVNPDGTGWWRVMGGQERSAQDSGQPLHVNQIGLAAYWFSLNFQTAALITIVIPETLTRLGPADRTAHLARLAALAAVVAMIVPPLVGMVSDKIRSHGGARRPLLIVGTLINMGGLYAVMQSRVLLTLTISFLVALVGQSVATAAYQAMMPEVVPRERWGLASGYMAVASLAGTVAGLATAGVEAPDIVYWAMAGTAGAGALYTSVTARERPVAPNADRPRVQVQDWHRFGWVFAGRFFMIFGQTILMTFVLYFFQDVLHVRRAAGGTALVAGLALVGAAVSAFWMGRASDRTNRATVVAWAGLPMAIAAAGFGFFPHPTVILGLAVLWGLGYGAFLSVDWALALDSIPDLANVARDLGLWGIASNLPAVAAPLVGGWILAAYVNPDVSYRVLFMLAGASFGAGSLAVLGIGQTRRAAALSQWFLVFIVAAMLRVYVGIVYRVRVTGRLPRDRGGILVVGNHQHDLEGMVIPAWVFWQNPLPGPVASAASRRLFEPGFLATRGPRGLGRWLTPVNLGPILSALGVHPIEDHPLARPPSSWAYEVFRRHGNLPVAEVFTPEWRERMSLPPEARLSDLWRMGRRPQEEPFVSHRRLALPYRREVRWQVRRQVDADLDALAGTLDRGITLYLTPEGKMTETGGLGRFRAALDRLVPHARSVWVAASAYDPWSYHRLALFTRFVAVEPGVSLRDWLLANRPVTVSQVLAAALVARPDGGTVRDLMQAVVRANPAPLGVVTTFEQADLRDAAERALRRLADKGAVIVRGPLWRPGPDRWDERFPHVPDLVQAQARQLRDTLAARERVDGARAETIARPSAQGGDPPGSHAQTGGLRRDARMPRPANR